jgi:hypothetical protein
MSKETQEEQLKGVEQALGRAFYFSFYQAAQEQ